MAELTWQWNSVLPEGGKRWPWPCTLHFAKAHHTYRSGKHDPPICNIPPSLDGFQTNKNGQPRLSSLHIPRYSANP